MRSLAKRSYSSSVVQAAVLLILSTTLMFSGCKQLTEAPKDAERLDAEFHASMSRGDWAGIYANADDGMRAKTSQEKFGQLFVAIANKLGQPVSTKQKSWKMNTTTSGTFLYSECETQFSKDASGTEAFIWKAADGTYRLYGYHINSEELITR